VLLFLSLRNVELSQLAFSGLDVKQGWNLIGEKKTNQNTIVHSSPSFWIANFVIYPEKHKTKIAVIQKGNAILNVTKFVPLHDIDLNIDA
jgi:hypothetical protein